MNTSETRSRKTIAALAGAGLVTAGLTGVALAADRNAQSAVLTDAQSDTQRNAQAATKGEALATAKGSGSAGVQEAAAGAAALRDGRVLPIHHFSVSAGWGHNSGPHAGRGHDGIDLAADTGEPVYAAADGKVVSAGDDGGGYGNMVRIRHADGTSTIYGHLSRFGVKKGQQVKAGQRIGAVGSTGHSTGPHLHFEVRNGKDVAINPNTYLGADTAELRKRTAKLKKSDK
jgi:murein DD-endopeptidase MepM/ murein hydrolase activator NlpD